MDGDRMINVIVMRLHLCLYCCIIIAPGERELGTAAIAEIAERHIRRSAYLRSL